MTKIAEKKIFQKLIQLDKMQNEIKVLKHYIFSIYPAEEKELFDAYQEIISGKTATLDDLIDDLNKDKRAKQV